MTTEGSFQSQKRRVGLRLPAPTSSARTSSRATLMAVGSTVGAMMSHSWSSQLVALVRARRTATATAPAEKPNNTSPGGSAAVMASAERGGRQIGGQPREGRVDVIEGLVRLQEEVAADADIVQQPADHAGQSTTTNLPP